MTSHSREKEFEHTDKIKATGKNLQMIMYF